MPPSHDLEQDPHELQLFQEQSTEKLIILLLTFKTFISVSPGQLFVPHDVEEVDDPEQSCPPYDGPFWVLERVLLPPPHVLEQDPHKLQSFQEQSTEKMIMLLLTFKTFISLPPGQLFSLHDVDEVDDPEHSCPPKDGPFWVLERVLLPPPHVFVQDPQELQVFQVHSTDLTII